MSKSLDHADLKDDREAFEKRLEELGPARAHTMLGQGMFPTTSGAVVLEWLAAKDADKAD